MYRLTCELIGEVGKEYIKIAKGTLAQMQSLLKEKATEDLKDNKMKIEKINLNFAYLSNPDFYDNGGWTGIKYFIIDSKTGNAIPDNEAREREKE